uniref:Uncharacterized protein n=1 Tax=Anguilla anguilla TaxID=7936 RepID=A0A0E9R7D4_ANGAN
MHCRYNFFPRAIKQDIFSQLSSVRCVPVTFGLKLSKLITFLAAQCRW